MTGVAVALPLSAGVLCFVVVEMDIEAHKLTDLYGILHARTCIAATLACNVAYVVLWSSWLGHAVIWHTKLHKMVPVGDGSS